MTEQPQKLRTFLCHASENKPVVSELYARLQADGFEPWLDSERLLPGMDWDLEIQQAMRASDAVIVCLSTISLKKEGYVQKEIKYAQEIQKEKPDGTIYLIPIQLEDCGVPYSLQDVQWGKYYEADGYEKIVKALKIRAAQLGRVLPKENSVPPGSLPSGSYLPFTRNALFTGREEDLLKLSALCDLSARQGYRGSDMVVFQVITGMGGVGKTQLAIEFAYRYGHTFKGVHWLDLRDPAQLETEIARNGERMLLEPWPDNLPAQVVLTLQTWQANGPRLLILDNFEQVGQANDVLAYFQDPGLRILVTSYHSAWPANLGFMPVSLEVFTGEESLKFLSKLLENRDDRTKDLERLAEHLGHLPLALELAGRYLDQHPHLEIPNYLAQLENILSHRSMDNWKPDQKSATKHNLSLAQTFALSWQQVREEAPQKAFVIAGFLAPNTSIPLEIFERALDVSQELCDETLEELFGLGLLRKLEDGSPAIHPLLAEFARNLDKENADLTRLSKLLAKMADERNDAVDRSGNYFLFTPLIAHVRYLAERAEGIQMEEAGILWNNLGYHIYDLADYRGAKVAFEHALKVYEAALGPSHPNVATVLNNLGLVLKAWGDLAGARAAFERALQIDEAAYGPDRPTVAKLVNNLGLVLHDMGDLTGAKAAYERALRISEATIGPNHPNVAIHVNNLGSVLIDLGDLNEAKAAFERALQIDKAFFGPDHPKVATHVNNLGKALQDLGDLNGAKAAYESALKSYEATYGPAHPKVATLAHNLGSVLQDLGELEEATAAYERALLIFQKFLPEGYTTIKLVQEKLEALSWRA